MVALATVATTLGLACSHDLDQFAEGHDTGVTPDTLADLADTAIADGSDSTPGETAADAGDADDASETVDATDADDTSDGACMVPAVDTGTGVDSGPPAPVVSCTTVGPPNTVCVSATTFALGTNRVACIGPSFAAEAPEVSVKVSAFFIDEHEVNVGRFRAWWNATTRAWPASNATIFTGGAGTTVRWKTAGTNPFPTAPTEPAIASGCTWLGGSDATNDDKPLNCVDWFTALGFCMSEGKRLPTEAEWELVASGGEDRLYPWSPPKSEDGPLTSVNCTQALSGSCSPLTTARDSTIWGRSKWGVWNMAGSVAEWTLDTFTSNYAAITPDTLDHTADPTGAATRVVRGGGHMVSGTDAFRAAARASGNASNKDNQIGFRCAKR